MISESYLSEVHSYSEGEDQYTFNQFTEDENTSQLGTTIAVVTDPTGGITEVCDEFIPELGMPKDLLNKFRQKRNELDITDDIERHNKAVEIVELEQKYRAYLKSDDTASEQVNKLCQRVKEGEDVTVVCFEKQPKWCHRHVLTEVINEKVSKE